MTRDRCAGNGNPVRTEASAHGIGIESSEMMGLRIRDRAPIMLERILGDASPPRYRTVMTEGSTRSSTIRK
jgi:hypothetical protein